MWENYVGAASHIVCVFAWVDAQEPVHTEGTSAVNGKRGLEEQQ